MEPGSTVITPSAYRTHTQAVGWMGSYDLLLTIKESPHVQTPPAAPPPSVRGAGPGIQLLLLLIQSVPGRLVSKVRGSASC